MAKVSAPLPDGMRGKSLLHRGSPDARGALLRQCAQLLRRAAAAVLPGFRPDWTHTDVTAPVYAESQGWDPVARMQHIDLFTWLRGDILVKADKMTMANSLELRVPFLDPEVFAVASRLPLDQKITRSTTKYALRRALEPVVPAARTQPAEARLPGAHPALAAGRRTAGLGVRDVADVVRRGELVDIGGGSDRCSTNTAAAQAITADDCGRC